MAQDLGASSISSSGGSPRIPRSSPARSTRAYEITALVVKLEREGRRRPVMLFENVKGTRFPVLTNLHASRVAPGRRDGAAPEAMLATYLRAMDKPDRRRGSWRRAR